MKKFNALVVFFLLSALILNACADQNVAALAPTDTMISPAAAPAEITQTEAPTEISAQPETIAVLTEISGDVQVKFAGQDAFSKAVLNTQLVKDSEVQTGDDGRARIDFLDGTITRVPPSTTSYIRSVTPSDEGLLKKIELQFGKLFIVLMGGSLDVETPSGVASVRGSYLNVEYFPETGRIRITCLEGHCSLRDSDEIVEITAGQTAEIAALGSSPQIGTMSEQDFQDWLDNSPESQLIIPEPTEPNLTFYFAPPKIPTKAPATEEVLPAPPSLPVNPPAPTLAPVVTINSLSPSVSAQSGQVILVGVSVVDSVGSTTIPTGSVSVMYGSNVLCTAGLNSVGSSSCSGAIFTPGSYTLTASYPGDANFVAAQSPGFSYAITNASTTTVLNNPVGPSSVNQSIPFTATVNAALGNPTGSVTISDGIDSCTVTSAPWTCNITFSSAGTKSFTATYSGDGTFYPSTSVAVSYIVDKYIPILDAVYINAPAQAIFIPGMDLDVEPFLYSGTETPVTFPTGMVTILDPISGNSCISSWVPAMQKWSQCTIIAAQGTLLDVTYSGDTNFNGFTITSYSPFFLS